MKLKQKLMEFGLAALLNGGCSDNLSHFTFAGRITDVIETGNEVQVKLNSPSMGYKATALLTKDRIPKDLYDRLEPGRYLRLQDCDMSVEDGVYRLENCGFYR